MRGYKGYLITTMSISVPAQTDSQYSAISSNQCSWCAVEFALKRRELIDSFQRTDKTEFHFHYNDCLLRASQKRKDLGTFLYGENIDSHNLLEHYGSQLQFAHKNTLRMNEDPEFVSILHPDLASEFYKRTYAENASLDTILTRMPYFSYLLLSRHGQSLCVLRVFANHYLLLDSHLHTARLATKEDTASHILMDNGGHTHLTLLFGV